MNLTAKEKKIVLYVKFFALHRSDCRNPRDAEELWSFIGKEFGDSAKAVEDIWNSIKIRYYMCDTSEAVKTDSLYLFLEEVKSLNLNNAGKQISTEDLQSDTDISTPKDKSTDTCVKTVDKILDTELTEHAEKPDLETNSQIDNKNENMEIDNMNKDTLAIDNAENQENSAMTDNDCASKNTPRSILDINCVDTDNETFFDKVSEYTTKFSSDVQEKLRSTQNDWGDMEISIRKFIEQKELNLYGNKMSQEHKISTDIVQKSSDVSTTLPDTHFDSVEVIFESGDEDEGSSTENTSQFENNGNKNALKRKHSGNIEDNNRPSSSEIEFLIDIKNEKIINKQMSLTDVEKYIYPKDNFVVPSNPAFYKGLAELVGRLSKKKQKQLRLKIGVLLADVELQMLKKKMPE